MRSESNTNSLPMQKPVEAGKHWFLARILVGRFLVLSGVLLAVSTSHSEQMPGFYLFIAIALLAFVPYSIWIKRQRWVSQAVSLQFLLDIVITTGLIHFSGGITSPFFVLYPLVILAAGLVSDGLLVIKITALASVSYSLIIALEVQGFLAFYGPDSGAELTFEEALTTGMVRVFLFVFFGAASAYLSAFIGYQNRQIRSYAGLVSTIIDHIPVGIFAVLNDGTIGMANLTAANLTGRHREKLCGMHFNALFVEETIPPDNLQNAAQASLINNREKVHLPVICATARTNVPKGFFGIKQEKMQFFRYATESSNTPVMIWAVRDIRAELKAKEDSQKALRLQTTRQVASELAHYVRNTLTAINGAAQLMRMAVADINDTPEVSFPEKTECIASMSKIIDKETDQLEVKLSEVLQHTEENPSVFSDEAATMYSKYLNSPNVPRHKS